MNLSIYANAMSKFKSTLESPSLGLNIEARDISYSGTVVSNTEKIF